MKKSYTFNEKEIFTKLFAQTSLTDEVIERKLSESSDLHVFRFDYEFKDNSISVDIYKNGKLINGCALSGFERKMYYIKSYEEFLTLMAS